MPVVCAGFKHCISKIAFPSVVEDAADVAGQIRMLFYMKNRLNLKLPMAKSDRPMSAGKVQNFGLPFRLARLYTSLVWMRISQATRTWGLGNVHQSC